MPQKRTRLRTPSMLIELRRRMCKARKESGLTLQQVGIEMGLEASGAKAVVHKLLTRSPDPTIFMLLRFCSATGISHNQLLDGLSQIQMA